MRLSNALKFSTLPFFELRRFTILTFLRFSFLSAILCLISTISKGQTVNNLGFESGTFTGWVGAIGQCCPVFTPNNGIDTSHHFITSGNSFDPYSNNLIPITAEGSDFSARLGNDNNSAESEMLEFTFTIPGDSLLLLIKYATVLEDGLHPAVKQPRFRYKILGSNLVVEGCKEKEIVAGGNSPGVVKIGNYEILPWQTDIVNLTGLAGETITLHFETGDCGPGGHFGYAYIDCELISGEIMSSGCNPDGCIVLIAPQGLNGTWHDGTSGDTLVISEPDASVNYFLELNNNSECEFRLKYFVEPFLPFVEFTSASNCNKLTAFYNHSIFPNGSFFNWSFGDGTSSNTFEPLHQYTSTGTFNTLLTVIQPDGCRASFTENIDLLLEFKIEIAATEYCIGTENTLNCLHSPISTPINFTTWQINGLVVSNSCNFTYPFYEPGNYTINLFAEDIYGCSDSISVQLDINEFCDLNNLAPFIPSAFTPNGDGNNEVFKLGNDLDFEKVTFTIFNRFGQVIYKGQHWDGKYLGIWCPAGVYGYLLSYEHENKGKFLTGTVAIVK